MNEPVNKDKEAVLKEAEKLAEAVRELIHRSNPTKKYSEDWEVRPDEMDMLSARLASFDEVKTQNDLQEEPPIVSEDRESEEITLWYFEGHWWVPHENAKVPRDGDVVGYPSGRSQRVGPYASLADPRVQKVLRLAKGSDVLMVTIE